MPIARHTSSASPQRPPEEVRLLELADAIENTTSVAYAVPDMGIDWVHGSFCPPKRRGGPPPTDITKEEWAEDLYGDGPIVPVPTPDE